jgi:hypothetical protein
MQTAGGGGKNSTEENPSGTMRHSR